MTMRLTTSVLILLLLPDIAALIGDPRHPL